MCGRNVPMLFCREIFVVIFECRTGCYTQVLDRLGDFRFFRLDSCDEYRVQVEIEVSEDWWKLVKSWNERLGKIGRWRDADDQYALRVCLSR